MAWLALVVTLAGMVLADVVDGMIGWTPTQTKGVLKFSNSTPHGSPFLVKSKRKMIKTAKIKILPDVVMLLHVLVRKI